MRLARPRAVTRGKELLFWRHKGCGSPDGTAVDQDKLARAGGHHGAGSDYRGAPRVSARPARRGPAKTAMSRSSSIVSVATSPPISPIRRRLQRPWPRRSKVVRSRDSFNNVGVVRPATLEDQTLDDLDATVQLNLRCAMQCAQALLPGMKAAGLGRIVNIASRAALGKELRTAYAATKAGLIGMAKTWALELGPHGITANAIGPGPIRTELFAPCQPRPGIRAPRPSSTRCRYAGSASRRISPMR